MVLLVVLVFLDHRCGEFDLSPLYRVSMSSHSCLFESIQILWIHAIRKEDCNHAKNVEYDEVPILESKCLNSYLFLLKLLQLVFT